LVREELISIAVEIWRGYVELNPASDGKEAEGTFNGIQKGWCC